jgi:DNA-binding beta-propeller fold protein YncE
MLYWCDTGNDKIGRCNPELGCDATTEDFVIDVGEPLRLAIDEDHGFVYYVERSEHKIWRCSVNVVPCQNPTLVVEVTPRTEVPYSIAIDPVEKMLYWTGHGAVQRCDISRPDNGGFPCVPENVVGPLDSLTGIVGIALDLEAHKLYWSMRTKIEECPMAAGQAQANIKIVTESVNQARGMAVDTVSGKLYIAEGIGSGTLSTIRTCPIVDGIATCPNTHELIGGCTSTGCMNMPFDVALDWSPASIAQETRTLPDWATQSAADSDAANSTS